MFITCVLKIPDPLSLSVKLQHCNIYLFSLLTTIIKVLPQILIETKKKVLLQIRKHEWNGPSRPPSSNLQKLLKKFMIPSIHYLLIK
jgi:hypothetical protein